MFPRGRKVVITKTCMEEVFDGLDDIRREVFEEYKFKRTIAKNFIG